MYVYIKGCWKVASNSVKQGVKVDCAGEENLKPGLFGKELDALTKFDVRWGGLKFPLPLWLCPPLNT